MLRETLLQVCSPGASSPNEGRGVSEVQQIRNTDSPSGLNESSCQVSGKEGTAELSTKGDTIADWQELNTYITALEKIEAWIHGRVVECVWWQVGYVLFIRSSMSQWVSCGPSWSSHNLLLSCIMCT